MSKPKLSPTQVRVLRALAQGQPKRFGTRYDTLLILERHGFIECGNLGLYFPNLLPAGRDYLATLEDKIGLMNENNTKTTWRPNL